MNKYLEKIAQMQMQASGSTQTTTSSTGGGSYGKKVGGFKSLRMGSHTTPDDLMPNPQKMDIRVK